MDIKKVIGVDKKIYNIFRELNVDEAEKFAIIGNLVKDLGFIEIGDKIKNKSGHFTSL